MHGNTDVTYTPALKSESPAVAMTCKEDVGMGLSV